MPAWRAPRWFVLRHRGSKCVPKTVGINPGTRQKGQNRDQIGRILSIRGPIRIQSGTIMTKSALSPPHFARGTPKIRVTERGVFNRKRAGSPIPAPHSLSHKGHRSLSHVSQDKRCPISPADGKAWPITSRKCVVNWSEAWNERRPRSPEVQYLSAPPRRHLFASQPMFMGSRRGRKAVIYRRLWPAASGRSQDLVSPAILPIGSDLHPPDHRD